MDERTRRAEELLEERLRGRGNGAPVEDRDEGTEDLRRRVEELTAALQRERADFANYRRRTDAERADYARFAKSDLITKLLEVLDNFDRALETVPAELRDQPWVEGIWLVERKLRDILASEGLEEISTVGKPFDPHVHEAIGHVASSEPEGTVVDEVRKAYKLHDKIIRPALVTVASGDVPRNKQEE
jgi:molecular chaperone GrpE